MAAQSRFTANSMFQRQLSTTALLSSSSSSSSAGSANAAAATGPSGPQAGRPASAASPRLFQRQMTASQLLSGGGGAQQAADNKQRAAALLGRGGADLGASQSTLGDPRQPARSPRRGELAGPQQGAPGAKNKRIISRMLSISAIHTSSALGGGGGSSGSDDHSDCSTPTTACSTASTATTTTTATMGDHQAPDKLDSSFTRSRSSSSGSMAAPGGGGGQESGGHECIQCLCLLDWSQATSAHSASSSPNNKSPAPIGGQHLALWLGTSQGSLLLVSLQMPDSEDNRVLQLQSVAAEPQPQAAIKLPGAILELASFAMEASQRTGAAHGGSSGSSLESPELSSSPPAAAAGGSFGAHAGSLEQTGSLDQQQQHRATCQFLCVVSEREARVYQIPQGHQHLEQQQSAAASGAPSSMVAGASHPMGGHHRTTTAAAAAQQEGGGQQVAAAAMANLLQRHCLVRSSLGDSSFVCRSRLVWCKPPASLHHHHQATNEEPCLVSYLANGQLRVHSLPRLRLLLDADFVPYTSQRLARSMEFSRQAHCLYRPSAGEICKFSVGAQYGALVNDMTGSLYVARDMPEQPRANFFKSLFSSAVGAATSATLMGGRSSNQAQSERDELFGECARGSRSVARHVGGVGGGAAEAKVGSAGHELRMAREGLDERGERLGELEDRTLQMMNQSESYAQAAHQLAQKFKDKKWYQF